MKQTWIRVLVIVVALGVVAAQAQSNVMLKGTVPFSFTVGDHTLPSGSYSVSSLGTETEAWYNQEGRGLFIIRTIPMGKQADLATYKLVFHRYGDRYFLSEIWNEGNSHELKVSDKEKELAKAQSFETIAVLMRPKM
jgi:hypothetical protein